MPGRLTLHGIELYLRTDLVIPGYLNIESATSGHVYYTTPVTYHPKVLINNDTADFAIYPEGFTDELDFIVVVEDIYVLAYRDRDGLEIREPQMIGPHPPGGLITVQPGQVPW